MDNQDKNPNPTPTQEQEQPKQTAVTPSEAHDLDKYTDTLQETESYGYYSEAEKLLKPIPYAKKNRKKYVFATGYAAFYHFISFILGVATIFLITKLLIDEDNPITFLFSALIYLILVAILGGLELFKSSSSVDFFKAIAKEETPTTGAKAGMFGTFVLSVIISAIGGGFLSLELNDKTLSIQNTSQIETDSLKSLYSSQIAAYDSSINSAQKTLIRYKTGWRANVARTDLEKATASKNEILDKLDGKLTTSQKLSETKILLADKENFDLALLVGFIVFFLESFCILAYKYKFIYLRNCEREGVNFGILQKKNVSHHTKNNDFDINEITESIKDLFKNLSNSIQNQVNNTESFQNKAYSRQGAGFQTYSSEYKTESKRNPIGFEYAQRKDDDRSNVHRNNDDRNTVNVGSEKARKRKCKNCNTEFEYKHWNKQYCSDTCRIEFWENSTGQKLKFSKKS